jgi:serine/threonine protein kinase
MDVDQISKRDLRSLSSVSDRYVVRSILGQGAFATVFLADDQTAGRPVVLKLLSEDGSSEAGIERFRAEVSAMRRLEHPNIVQVLGEGVTMDNRPYLVTQWIGGRSLAAVLKESGPLTAARAIDVGHGIAGALAYVHSRGLVHRDVKPSNILIPGWPDAPDYKNSTLLDFGVAGRLEQGRTQVGMIFGTLRYMSPEQIRGEQQSAATDVYGFGLLLFEMLVGRSPANRAGDLATLVMAISQGIPAEELRSVEPALAVLISRCVRPDPAERPSIAEVLQALTAEPQTIATLRPSPLPLAPADVASPTQPAISTGALPAAKASSAQSAPEAPFIPPFTVTGEPREPAVSQGKGPPFWAAVSLAAATAAVALILLIRAPVIPPSQPSLHPPPISESAPPSTSAPPSNESTVRALRFGAGLLLMGASISIAFWLRKWLGSRSQVKSEAIELVFGAKTRTDLTATIAVQLDQLVSRLRRLDERILAGSVALMLNEYGSATDPKDRQAALMNVVVLSEKLAVRLSPWYERHKEIIASAVAVMGGVSGLVTALNSVLGHKH